MGGLGVPDRDGGGRVSWVKRFEYDFVCGGTVGPSETVDGLLLSTASGCRLEGHDATCWACSGTLRSDLLFEDGIVQAPEGSWFETVE